MSLARRAVGYLLAGAMNTALGYGVVLVFDLGLRVAPALANAAGFAAGALLSFFLHRRIFDGAGGREERTRYALAVALAFGANQIVLALAPAALGWLPGPLARAAAQGAAVGTYAVGLFVLNQTWVFRPGEAAGSDVARPDPAGPARLSESRPA